MSDGGDGVFERTKQKQKSFNLLLYFLRHHKRFRFHRRMQSGQEIFILEKHFKVGNEMKITANQVDCGLNI